MGVLAGQYVLVRFQVGDGADTGCVIWQPRRGVDIPVAQFRHTMDNHNAIPSEWRLYRKVEHLEFEEEPPGNQVLDMEQLQNQMRRTLRKSVDLSDGVRYVEEASDVIRPTGP